MPSISNATLRSVGSSHSSSLSFESSFDHSDHSSSVVVVGLSQTHHHDHQQQQPTVAAAAIGGVVRLPTTKMKIKTTTKTKKMMTKEYWKTNPRRGIIVVLLVIVFVVVGILGAAIITAITSSSAASTTTTTRNNNNSTGDGTTTTTTPTTTIIPSSICEIPVVGPSLDLSSSSLLRLGDVSALQLWIQHISKIHQASRLSLVVVDDNNDDDDLLLQRQSSYDDFTIQLLTLITSHLQYSIKSLPKDWNLINRLLQKAYTRYKYLIQVQQDQQHDHDQPNNNNTSSIPPPIRITVMGGSVTLGIQCHSTTTQQEYNHSTTKYCAWPYRLETLINELFGVGRIIEVMNEAVGATNTKIGTTILQYNIIPNLVQSSDIIIHSYSTNDAGHSSTHDFFHTLQTFCRLVLQPPYLQQEKEFILCQKRSSKRDSNNNNNKEQQDVLEDTDDEDHDDEDQDQSKKLHQDEDSTTTVHHRPLFIHIDDVLTSLYTPVRNYASLPGRVSTLANYYGFMSLSYADMVRDYVYADPKETWFSTNEFPNGVYHFDIHPGQGMHISMSWMVAYAMLHITTTYCTWKNEFWTSTTTTATTAATTTNENGSLDDPMKEQRDGMDDDEATVSNRDNALFSYSLVAEYEETILSQRIPHFRNVTKDVRNEGIKPHLPPPQGLLPPLDTKMTPSDLNAQWRAEAKQIRLAQNRPCPRSNNGKFGGETCPFTWVSGHDQSKNRTWVQKNVISRLIEPTTWELETHFTFRKTGLTPPMGDVGATMNFQYHLPPDSSSNHDGPLRTVVLFYLKSYGPTWEKSRALIELFTSQSQSQKPKPPLAVSNHMDSKSYDTSIDVQWKQVTKLELVGHHNRSTSEMYVETLSFDIGSSSDTGEEFAGNVGGDQQTLRLQATLVGGKTFKIMGFAFCH